MENAEYSVFRRIRGGLAQLVERCDRTAEVRDSSSLSSIFFVICQIICLRCQIAVRVAKLLSTLSNNFVID